MIKLTLPTKIDDCKPEQLAKWLLISDAIKNRKDDSIVRLLEFQCQLLSIFSGVPISKIKKGNIDDIQDASRSLIEMFASYEYKEPSGKVKIDGVTYVFEKDFRFISTGQIIDLKLIEDISENPSQAVAICYIEEGKDYCHEDERGRVVNPTSDRMKLFKEHFPGEEFLNFFGFFFARLRDAERRYIGDSDGETDDEEDGTRGVVKDSEWYIWTTIIHQLSKEMGKGLEEITRQPYVKSLFWMNYLKLLNEQKRILLNG